jgi:hypothetical protein
MPPTIDLGSTARRGLRRSCSSPFNQQRDSNGSEVLAAFAAHKGEVTEGSLAAV